MFRLVINKEVWKPVVGYEGYYEVSNYGNVRTLNFNRTGKIKYLSQCDNSNKYLCVQLSYNNKKFARVHRLVAKAFLPNPNNYPVINHKDENRHNNIVWINEDGSVDPEKSNLEWCSQLYNLHYTAAWKKQQKAVLKIENGIVVEEYESIAEAARQNNMYDSNQIIDVCNGKRKQSHGYNWKYKEDYYGKDYTN